MTEDDGTFYTHYPVPITGNSITSQMVAASYIVDIRADT